MNEYNIYEEEDLDNEIIEEEIIGEFSDLDEEELEEIMEQLREIEGERKIIKFNLKRDL